MKTNLWWVISIVSFLVASAISFKMYRDIGEDKSSTAAIGYLVIPFVFIFVVIASAVFLWAANNIVLVVRSLQPWSQFSSILSFVIVTVYLIGFAVIYDIHRGSKPEQSTDSLKALYERYKNVPLLRSLALGSIVSNENAPTDLLEREVKNSNYQASQNPGLPAALIEKLIVEIPGENWGILCNLAGHKNLNENSVTLLLDKANGKFETEEDRKSYKDCVLGQLRFQEITPKKIKKMLEKQLGY